MQKSSQCLFNKCNQSRIYNYPTKNKAEELNKYFSSVFTHEDDSCPRIHLNSELTNIVISVEEVEQLLSNIRSST